MKARVEDQSTQGSKAAPSAHELQKAADRSQLAADKSELDKLRAEVAVKQVVPVSEIVVLKSQKS